MVALSIIIILLSLAIWIFMMKSLFARLDKQNPTEALPKASPPKTIEEVIKSALKNPPIGCMWEVKKTIKHYRKLPNGRNVFDGSIDAVFAEIKLITPFGAGRVFSLPVDHDFFEHNVTYNAKASIKEYEEQLAEIENHKKQIDDEWDGVYS